MIIERLIFNIVAFALFTIIFLNMIRKNDTNYIYILAIQALGILMGFIGLVCRINLPIIIILFTYIASIIIPLAIIIFEIKGISFSEIIYLCIAQYYSKKGNNKKAKEILMKMIEKYPNSYYLHRELARISEQTKDIEIAIDEYIRALDINKSDLELQLKLAGLLKNVNRNEDATKTLKEVLKLKPSYYEASCLLGDILYEQENYKEAVNVYIQALNYNPDKYELYYNLGMAYTRLNDFQSAKEYYEKAAELNSLLYHAKYNLGQIALLYNEIEEAEEYFIECVNEEELSDEAYYYLAYIEMLKGNKENAIQYLNTAVEDDEELYKRATKELVFKMIINKIKKPVHNENKAKKKLTAKELKTIKHLERTCELVGSLSQNDMKAIRILKTKNQDKERE
ncbi:MAG: tetratricopeptide repeat protein [Clostridia bacterium]|nr:tetratricopeptide repeat protein [Clostridia bacterium]